MKNRAKAELLIGTWHRSDSSCEVIIRITNSSLKVRARDRDDNEEFEVTDVDWDGESLSFNSLTPSVGWISKHRLTPRRGSTVAHEVAYVEVWTKQKPRGGTGRR